MKKDKEPFVKSVPAKTTVVPNPLSMLQNPPLYPLPIKPVNRKAE
jgi:hypothetical protein